jgi:hypothetical protein
MVLLGRGGVTVLGMSTSIAAYMLLTMREWLPHPPAWAQRPTPCKKNQSCAEGKS